MWMKDFYQKCGTEIFTGKVRRRKKTAVWILLEMWIFSGLMIAIDYDSAVSDSNAKLFLMHLSVWHPQWSILLYVATFSERSGFLALSKTSVDNSCQLLNLSKGSLQQLEEENAAAPRFDWDSRPNSVKLSSFICALIRSTHQPVAATKLMKWKMYLLEAN